MQQWYNENEFRTYPFREDAVLAEAATGVLLPSNVVADLSLITEAVGEIRVTRIVYGNGLASLALASSVADIGTVIAYPVAPYTPYPIQSVTGKTTGYVVFGIGVMTASRTVARFQNLVLESRTCRRQPSVGVEALGKTGLAATLSGYVKLEFGKDLDYAVAVDAGTTTITISLKPDNAQLYIGPCSRGDSINHCKYPPLRSINGVGGDNDGVITLEFV